MHPGALQWSLPDSKFRSLPDTKKQVKDGLPGMGRSSVSVRQRPNVENGSRREYHAQLQFPMSGVENKVYSVDMTPIGKVVYRRDVSSTFMVRTSFRVKTGPIVLL